MVGVTAALAMLVMWMSGNINAKRETAWRTAEWLRLLIERNQASLDRIEITEVLEMWERAERTPWPGHYLGRLVDWLPPKTGPARQRAEKSGPTTAGRRRRRTASRSRDERHRPETVEP